MKLLLSLISGLALVLVHPGWNLAWLAPAALAPLLYVAAQERNPWRRLLWGEVAGIVYWFGVCYWIQFVLEVHGNMGKWGGWGTFLLFCIAKGAHMAVFAALSGPLLRRAWAIPAVAALWVGIERTHGPLGFPWLALGNAGIDMGIPLRLAPLVGVYGVSFVFVMMNVAFTLAVLRRPRRQLAPLVILFGLFALPPLPEPKPGRQVAVTVQPNIPQEAPRWGVEGAADLVDRLARLTLAEALKPGESPADLLVWPESPAPFYYYADFNFQRQVQQLARAARRPFLFGAVSFTPAGNPMNSSLMLDPEGRLVARYDKMYLVPFGEYVPPLFGWVNRITQEAGDFVPGRALSLMPAGNSRVGPFICYESAFPHLVRQFARAGADVLVNLTNDGYFGRSSARLQHLALARMRAVENRRWVLRPTNDGYTASIDPSGRVVAMLPPYEVTAARLPFDRITEQTLYTRSGDWFAWISLAAGLIAAAAAAVVPQYRPEPK